MDLLLSFIEAASARQEQLIAAFQAHLLLVVVPVSAATVVSIPLGIWATRNEVVEAFAIGVANVLQTIPSLALLAIMIPLGVGIGRRPAYLALFLYAILPILRNTYTGIKEVDEPLKQAAQGVGMTDLQVLRKVELPLAVPVIMAGIRTSTVIIIGTAVLAAYIGGGGFGEFIVTGLSTIRDDLILVGAVPSALLALLGDQLLGFVEYLVTPKGLKI